MIPSTKQYICGSQIDGSSVEPISGSLLHEKALIFNKEYGMGLTKFTLEGKKMFGDIHAEESVKKFLGFFQNTLVF